MHSTEEIVTRSLKSPLNHIALEFFASNIYFCYLVNLLVKSLPALFCRHSQTNGLDRP